jgi:hypothetical protein
MFGRMAPAQATQTRVDHRRPTLKGDKRAALRSAPMRVRRSRRPLASVRHERRRGHTPAGWRRSTATYRATPAGVTGVRSATALGSSAAAAAAISCARAVGLRSVSCSAEATPLFRVWRRRVSQARASVAPLARSPWGDRGMWRLRAGSISDVLFGRRPMRPRPAPKPSGTSGPSKP